MISAGLRTPGVRLFDRALLQQPTSGLVFQAGGRHTPVAPPPLPCRYNHNPWLVSCAGWQDTKDHILRALETPAGAVEAFTYVAADPAARSDAFFEVETKRGLALRLLLFQLGPFHRCLPGMPQGATFLIECAVVDLAALAAFAEVNPDEDQDLDIERWTWFDWFAHAASLSRVSPASLDAWCEGAAGRPRCCRGLPVVNPNQ